MSLFETINTMKLVRAGPSVGERLERWVAARHHAAIVTRLRRFRERLEHDMAPEPWTALEAPMPLIVADLCDALRLTEEERAEVLGHTGALALAEILETRPIPRSHALLNVRQARALAHVREHGRITNREYQALCPDVSTETLRLDLADLVARGLLTKNGRKKGTTYTMAA